jgi:hypothetical protein
LAAHQPVTIAELADLLVGEGLTPPEGEDPLTWAINHLVALPGSWQLPDGRVIDAHTCCEGLTLTHRLTMAEIATGVIAMEPDLIPLLLITRGQGDDHVVLASGGRGIIGRFFPPIGKRAFWNGACEQFGLKVPRARLARFAGGDLIIVRVVKGRLSIRKVSQNLPLSEAVVQSLRAAYVKVCMAEPARHEQDERPAQILDVFAVALTEQQSGAFPEFPESPLRLRTPSQQQSRLFARPLRPLGELLEATGLKVDGQLLKLSEPLEGFDEVGEAAVSILLQAYELFLVDRIEVMETLQLAPIILARMLCGPMVATMFVVKTMFHEPQNESKVAAFAQSLLGDHPFNAGPHLLLTYCAATRGDTVAGEEHVTEALRTLPEQSDALKLAASYAEDRGDATRALDYLRRAGGNPSLPRVTQLKRFTIPGPTTAERAQPCPCGSGRAHGICCAPRNGHPLHTRAEWLFSKATAYLLRPPSLLTMGAIAKARTCNDPTPFTAERAALSDTLVQDLGLFEGGVLADFLDVRGVLLPADELELGRCWVDVRRSLYEVTAVAVDEQLIRLRDLRTGDEVEVTEEDGVHTLTPGVLLYARVLPDGRGYRLLGAVLPIPAGLRNDLLGILDRDPTEIARWFTENGQPWGV